MAISINPVLPVLSAQEAGGIAPELVLQPGSVVNAQVLKVLSADLVRIAIASLSIDVATEIPLQQGQNLQLAVTQTKDGIRLAMVGQGGDAGSLGDAVTLSPDALAEMPVNRPAILTPKSALTPLERAAVSAAAQAAVTEQDSLAPLFANLGAAVSSSNLPPKLQAAIAQVLAQQTSLDQNLGGGDIKTAFQKSGIFLEASLAAGSIPASGVPDLKAALIVLRQTLQSALGAGAPGATPPTPAGAPQATPPQIAAPNLAPSSINPDVNEIVLPQARLPVAENLASAGSAVRNPLAAALDRGPSAGATLNLLQEALQELGNHCAACAARGHRTSSARRHRRRHRAADPATGGVAAGSDRHVGAEGRHDGAALEFRNSIRNTARHGDGAIRDFPRQRRAGSRGRQTDVARALLARRRAGRAGSRADLAPGRQDLGADLGGTVFHGGTTTRRRLRTEPGAEPGRASARRYRDPGRGAAASRTRRPCRPLPGPRAMSVDVKNKLAVALHYDKTGAPRVVAKGKGTIGAKIVELAREHDIPIEENEVLAGALSHVEIGDEIPPDLYKAVAEVLIFVLRLSGRVR
jgi:FlhB-like protein